MENNVISRDYCPPFSRFWKCHSRSSLGPLTIATNLCQQGESKEAPRHQVRVSVLPLMSSNSLFLSIHFFLIFQFIYLHFHLLSETATQFSICPKFSHAPRSTPHALVPTQCPSSTPSPTRRQGLQSRHCKDFLTTVVGPTTGEVVAIKAYFLRVFLDAHDCYAA